MRTLSPRNRELLNLIAVGMLTGLGFTSVYIARSEVVSPESLTYAAFFLLVYLVAHVVTRLTVPYADPYLLPMAGLLTAIGLTEIYRLNPDDAFRQGLWVVIGVALFSVTLVALRRDYRRLESYKYVLGLGALALLVLPAVPVVGRDIRGARLWVELGPFRFQPGEFAKILLIVFLAGYLREKREVLAQGRLKDFGPLLLIWGGAMAVLVQTNDLGSGLLYFGIFLGMLYVATSRIVFVVGGLALFLAGAAFVYQVIPRVQDRVTIWLDPWPYVEDESYQLVQSLFAIAFGGFGGTGLGRGTFTTTGGQNLIPDLNTDFIYSALAHELGLAGVAAVLLVYMLFVARGFRIGFAGQDDFGKLLGVGLAFVVALQVFIVVGGVTRVIPLTGLTTPFMAAGGSSLVANWIIVALLLRLSDTVRNHPRLVIDG